MDTKWVKVLFFETSIWNGLEIYGKGVYRTQSIIYDGALGENGQRFYVLNYFRAKAPL